MSETDTKHVNMCFGYKHDQNKGEICSVLADDASKEYRNRGYCGSMACPFYKPKYAAKKSARIGNSFKPYTQKQLLIAEIYDRVIKAEKKISRRKDHGVN